MSSPVAIRYWGRDDDGRVDYSRQVDAVVWSPAPPQGLYVIPLDGPRRVVRVISRGDNWTQAKETSPRPTPRRVPAPGPPAESLF